MKSNIVRVMAAIAAVAMWGYAATASAEGGYVGLSIGSTKIDVCGGIGSCDDTDTGYRLLGGYNINDIVAVELAYNDAGQVSMGAAKVDVTAWTVAAKAAKAINDKFSVLGTLGYAHWKADANNAAGGGSDTGNDIMYSIGAQYNVNDAIGIRGEWGRINADEDVDQLSIGVVYSFN